MSAYMIFKDYKEILSYLENVDYPKCFTVNYLPDSCEYALWIGNQPYYIYEELIKLEQDEKNEFRKILSFIGQQYEMDFTENELSKLSPRDKVIYNISRNLKL